METLGRFGTSDLFHEPPRQQPKFMDQIRQAVCVPNPMSEILAEHRTAAASATGRPKPRRSRTVDSETSLDSPGGSSRSKKSYSDSALSVALEAGERHSMQLKTALLTLGGRLEEEIRRSDELETKLEKALGRIKHSDIKLAATEMARQNAEQTAAIASEDVKRVTRELEHAKQELVRAQTAINDLSQARERAIENAKRSQHMAREYQLALNETAALMRGRQEGQYIASRRAVMASQAEDEEEMDRRVRRLEWEASGARHSPLALGGGGGSTVAEQAGSSSSQVQHADTESINRAMTRWGRNVEKSERHSETERREFITRLEQLLAAGHGEDDESPIAAAAPAGGG